MLEAPAKHQLEALNWKIHRILISTIQLVKPRVSESRLWAYPLTRNLDHFLDDIIEIKKMKQNI